VISNSLNEIFQKSISLAKKLNHEYLTIEHVFLILLNSEKGIEILTLCGANIDDLKKELSTYIRTNIDPLPKNIEQDPHESVALSRLIDNMIRHIQSAQKQNADVGDLLASIYEEENTFSYMLLNHYEIDRLDILEIISHDNIKFTTTDTSDTFLKKYSIDLLQKAEDGKIDPVIGRDKEIKRVIQILCRRKKNNPILVGEPGVGKTAIAEGLALSIVASQVPDILKTTKLYALDLSALIAGTKYRGEFEKRLKGVMDELKYIPNAVLFIDEIHTLIGAGSTNGTMDAANQLKPALASGEIKCMGATTFAEYRNSFEKDKALSRRFSTVNIDEPSKKTTFKILRGLKSKYEIYHNVKYTNNALEDAIKLSQRYLTDRFLPDKAIDILDETAAALHLSKRQKRKITTKDIHKTISSIIGIPTSTLNKNNILLLKNLENNLKINVIGQNNAITQVVKAIKISKAGLTQKQKPIASFLFSGPTGVGKTELAISLSRQLNINYERFDMSEYMEKHTISRLVGAPPGYVGYEQGGLLTETIKKHPYSVLLLDEIEKAHPDLINILLQVMDNATLTDNNGYKANFQNVILIMTSNIGANSRSIMGFNKDENLSKDEDLKSFFTPEFRNRLTSVINFNPLDKSTTKNIVAKFIKELNKELKKKKITIKLTQKATEYIAETTYSKEMGARPLKRYIQDNITNKLSDEILFGKLITGGLVNIDYDKKLIISYKEL